MIPIQVQRGTAEKVDDSLVARLAGELENYHQEALSADEDKLYAWNGRQDAWHRADARWIAAKTFLERGIEAYETKPGVFLVRGHDEWLYFFPASRKWRAAGRAKIYWSRGVDDFIDRFVLDEWRKARVLSESA